MAETTTARKDFLATLQSDPGTYSGMPEGPRKNLDATIREHIRKMGQIGGVEGAFGDFVGASAYVESVTKPPEGGTFTKFYGCPYLYKGEVIGATVDSVAVTKGAIFETLVLFTRFPFVLALPLFLIPAGRKEILNWVLKIYFKDLEKRQLPLKEYKQGIRELMRLGFRYFPERLVYLFATIFENDNAYWFPLQDALSELKRENILNRGVIYEVGRMFNILIDRQNFDTPTPIMADKFRKVKKIILLVLYLSPTARKIAKEMLLDLDLSQITPDEADTYFTLNRRSYNYRGIPFEERLRRWEKINQQYGIIVLGI